MVGKGKRCVEIKLIEDRARRHTTFTKRRQGLMKKTGEFAAKFGAQAAVVVFSRAGNAFAFGDPSVDSLIGRYLAEQGGGREGGAGEERSWNAVVEGLGPREIDELAAEITKLKRVVAARAAEAVARGERCCSPGRGPTAESGNHENCDIS